MACRAATTIRLPAVAGLFYPARAAALREEVSRLLQEALPPPAAEGTLKAVVVPHAGYIYSGPVAATAYRLLEREAGRIRKVVLLGPAHYVPVRGLALPSAQLLGTPLGDVPVWEEGRSTLSGLSQVVIDDEAHAREHSLEVQLPFLAVCLRAIEVLPLAVGDAAPEEVAEVLGKVWGGPETLIVVSTDLSHYLDHETARRIDAETARRILHRDITLPAERACGAAPLCGLLLAARRYGLGVSLLDLRSSGDTAGDRARVVGYGAFALREAAA